jgi:hypothetical protein
MDTSIDACVCQTQSYLCNKQVLDVSFDEEYIAGKFFYPLMSTRPPKLFFLVLFLCAHPVSTWSQSGAICNYRDGRGWVPCVSGPPRTYTPPPDPAALEAQRKAKEAADSNDAGLAAMASEDWVSAEAFFSHAVALVPDNHTYSENLSEARRELNAVNERLRKEQEEREKFERDKAEMLQNLKTVTSDGVRNSGPVELKLKTVTAEDQPKPPPKVEPRIGAAANVSGDVSVVRSGKKEKVGPGFAVHANDHVVLGPDGHLQVLLLDETVFTLGPNSDMVLDEFVYDPSTSVSKIIATITKGVFRFVTGKVKRAESDDSRFRFAYGTIGIRGTDFEANMTGSGAGTVTLYSGSIDYTDAKTKEVLTLRPGETLTIAIGGSLRINRPMVTGPKTRPHASGR